MSDILMTYEVFLLLHALFQFGLTIVLIKNTGLFGGVNTSDIRMTYEYIQMTYECHMSTYE